MSARGAANAAEKLRRPPATTPEGRENQMIAAAIDLAEKQIIEGTASSQVITHFLKLGSTRERLEQENLSKKNELVGAQIQELASRKKVEELYAEALTAMRTYTGEADPSDQFNIDDDYEEN